MDKQTILVVDDELVGRQLLNAVLISDGYNVLLAENGSKAIEIAEKDIPDLILMDVMMPDMDGFTTIQKIKDIDSISHIPIILVTALDDRDNRIKGLESGATDYITKPFDRIEVLAKIKNHTQKSAILKSKNSNAKQSQDWDEKIQTLITEILDSHPDADHINIKLKIYNNEDVENYTGKYFSNTSNNINYCLFGSDQPTEEDKFQIALIKIWLYQLKNKNSLSAETCSIIHANIRKNNYFKKKNWWFIHIFNNQDGKFFASGINQEMQIFGKGISTKETSTGNISFSLSENNPKELTDINLVLCSLFKIPDIAENRSVYQEIEQLITENKIYDIEKSIKNIVIKESDNKNIISGIQIN